MKDYRVLIIQTYKLRKKDPTWRPNLSRPTPNTIKEECETVCKERWAPADAESLRQFFGPCPDMTTTLKAIQNSPVDKFRPILNFLKERTTEPADKVVEITAWLLDVQPRPHDIAIDYSQMLNEMLNAGKESQFIGKQSDQEDPLPSNMTHRESESDESAINFIDMPSSKKESTRTASFFNRINGKQYLKPALISVLAFAVFTIAGSTIFGWWGKAPSKNNLAGLQSCMYWAGNEYKEVSCNARFGFDTLVVAYDSVTFHTMKKVTRPDTITLHSLGRLWYIKRDKKYHFFTSAGAYPPEPTSKLRPVTVRILNTHMSSYQDLSNKTK